MLAEPSSFDTRVFVDEPEEYSKERKKHSESNGEDNSKNDGELSPQSLDMKHGYDPYKDRKSTRLNSSHVRTTRMPSSA